MSEDRNLRRYAVANPMTDEEYQFERMMLHDVEAHQLSGWLGQFTTEQRNKLRQILDRRFQEDLK